MQKTEPLLPLYYDRDILMKSPIVLYRTSHHGSRYYYTIANNLFKKYPSVTTVLDKVMPTSEYLIKWISQYGWEKAEEIKKQKGDYGTLLHILISQFLIDQKFESDSLRAVIATYKADHNITYDTSSWYNDLKKDIYAFHIFAAKHEVKPIAISIMLLSDRLQIAGELDMVIQMKVGTGVNGNILKNDLKVDKNGEIKEDKTRTINAILDIKSGRHGFYPNQEAQLHLYKELWNDNFPHILIDALYNWAPKTWNEEPEYSLKEQSGSNEARKINLYIQLFQIDENVNPRLKNVPVLEGTFELGKVNGNLKVKTLDNVLEKSIQLIDPTEAINGLTNSQKVFGIEEEPTPRPDNFHYATTEGGKKIRNAKDMSPEDFSAVLEFATVEMPEPTLPENEGSEALKEHRKVLKFKKDLEARGQSISYDDCKKALKTAIPAKANIEQELEKIFNS